MSKLITLLSDSWSLVSSASITVSGTDIAALYADMMLLRNRSVRASWLSIRGEHTVSSPYIAPAIHPDNDEEDSLYTSAERLAALLEQLPSLVLPEASFGILLTCPDGTDHTTWKKWTDLKTTAACHKITHDVIHALTALEDMQRQQPDIEHWLWLSVDSLIDRSTLLNIDTALMHDDNPEGILPGEAAVLIHLTRHSLANGTRLSALQHAEEINAAQSVQQPVDALTQLIGATQHQEKPLMRVVCNASMDRLHASELHKTQQAIAQANLNDNLASPSFQTFYATTGELGLSSFPLTLALAAQGLADPWHSPAGSSIGCAHLHKNQRLFISLSAAQQASEATNSTEHLNTQLTHNTQAMDYV